MVVAAVAVTPRSKNKNSLSQNRRIGQKKPSDQFHIRCYFAHTEFWELFLLFLAKTIQHNEMTQSIEAMTKYQVRHVTKVWLPSTRE